MFNLDYVERRCIMWELPFYVRMPHGTGYFSTFAWNDLILYLPIIAFFSLLPCVYCNIFTSSGTYRPQRAERFGDNNVTAFMYMQYVYEWWMFRSFRFIPYGIPAHYHLPSLNLVLKDCNNRSPSQNETHILLLPSGGYLVPGTLHHHLPFPPSQEGPGGRSNPTPRQSNRPPP